MANMIPTLVASNGSSAEAKLYFALNEQLPNSFHIFHSLDYVNLDPAAGISIGEVDFLVVHKELGIMVIEVKGGVEVGADRSTGEWYSISRFGKLHMIKDPVKQGQRNIRDMIDKVRESEVFGQERYLPFTYCSAVAFPEIEVDDGAPLPPNLPRELLIDASDLGSLRKKIEGIFASVRGTNRVPGMNGKEFDGLLNRVLMPKFKVARSVAQEISEEEMVLQQMTEEQENILDALEDQDSAIITGPAGTGKTFLAMEQARRFAVDDKEVLLLCFNRLLAEHLKSIANGISPSITVNTFHDLCLAMADEAGITYEVPPPYDDRKKEKEFWRTDAPLLMSGANETLCLGYDAIVIDEGQDFEVDWVDTLKELWRDPESGSLFIFMDPLQNIYSRDLSGSVTGGTFKLKHNCRNTIEIANHLSGLVGAEYKFPREAVQGRKVEHHTYRDEKEELKRIEAVVRGLLSDGADPESITILCPRRRSNSCLADRDSVSGLTIDDGSLPDRDRSKRYITFSTIQRFKGLEADIVIICDLNDTFPANDSALRYVGTSRAKHQLYVFEEEGAANDLQ